MHAQKKGVMVATCESCTGGLIAGALTDVAGSSAVLERGFVTYSNEAKTEMLGVAPDLIAKVGAVSAEVARSMAAGGVDRSRAHIAISVTGIAGPGGGTEEKPIGLVWFGLCIKGRRARTERHVFPTGSRAFVRTKATETGLRLLLSGIAAI